MTVGRLVAVSFGVWWKSSARLVDGAAMRNAIAAVTGGSWLIWLVVATRANQDAGVDPALAADQRLFESLTILTTGRLDRVGDRQPLPSLAHGARQRGRSASSDPVPAHAEPTTGTGAALVPVCIAVLAPVIWPLLHSTVLDQSLTPPCSCWRPRSGSERCSDRSPT